MSTSIDNGGKIVGFFLDDDHTEEEDMLCTSTSRRISVSTILVDAVKRMRIVMLTMLLFADGDALQKQNKKVQHRARMIEQQDDTHEEEYW
jgi:hypothetical protein